MNLGVFLSIGESFGDYKKKGQDELIINYLLKNYSRNFEKVFVFSYANESFTLFNNVYIVPNRFLLHRYLYSLVLPIINYKYIRKCQIFRGLQLTGGIPAVITKLIFKKKFVINYGYEYSRFAQIEKKPLQSWIFKVIEKPLLSIADTVIVTAKYLRKKLSSFVPLSKLNCLPNGVDTDLFKQKDLKKEFSLLFVGRFEPQKNIPALLKAVRLLKLKQKKLLLIGGGSEEKLLLKIALLYNIDLKIYPSVPHDQLPFYFNKSEIFVLPSLIEGQPKVLLEAMSCGLPVIASNIEAHREIIVPYENGILSATDEVNLAKSIGLLLENKKLRRKIGMAARKTILSQYSKKLLNLREIHLLKNLIN